MKTETLYVHCCRILREKSHSEKAARLSPVSLRPASNFIDSINRDRSDVPVSCISVLIGYDFVFFNFCPSCEQ